MLHSHGSVLAHPWNTKRSTFTKDVGQRPEPQDQSDDRSCRQRDGFTLSLATPNCVLCDARDQGKEAFTIGQPKKFKPVADGGWRSFFLETGCGCIRSLRVGEQTSDAEQGERDSGHAQTG
eukprot:scaffold31226_cov28-Tisochrysis_lutea.AAC.2